MFASSMLGCPLLLITFASDYPAPIEVKVMVNFISSDHQEVPVRDAHNTQQITVMSSKKKKMAFGAL
jgi:hypothetical protein